jgi:hypothetical protein
MAKKRCVMGARAGGLRWWCLLVVAMGTLWGCELPEDDLGPQTVRVFTPDEAGVYGLVDRELTTLESARRMRGAAVKMRGGGSVFVEAGILDGSLTADSEEKIRETRLVKGDRRIEAEYLKEDGVLVPTDWDTLVMFSFYHHIEGGLAFFRELGVPDDALRPTRCFFKVRFTSAFVFGQPLITDNAAYAPAADAFFLFPNQLLNAGVPLALNQGVSVHELSHAVKHRIIHGDKRLSITTEDWTSAAANTYASVDEGLADFFAAHHTGNPNFIEVSIDESFELERDISEEKVFSEELLADVDGDGLTYNPYLLGTAVASWLWAITDDVDERGLVAKGVVDTLKNLRAILGPDYTLTDFLNHVVLHLDAGLQARACELLDKRLGEKFAEVVTCGTV